VFDCGHCGKKTDYRPEEYVACPLTDQYVELKGFCHNWSLRPELLDEIQGGEDG